MASLEWYRSFVHVCRSGTVSAAARTLGLTQPAVSQHLAGLEAALGERLFQRTRQRMLLTMHGHTLYSRVADAVERLEAASGGEQGSEPTLRLGAPHEYFYARLLRRLPAALQPLAVTLGSAQELLDSLQAGRLDAVVSTIKRPSAALSYRGLFEEKFWLVGPPQTPRQNRRELGRFVREQRWVAYAPELPIIRRFLRQVLGQRVAVTPVLTVPDLRAVRQAVELGIGVSVLPDYLCEQSVQAGRLSLCYEPREPVTNDLWWVTERQSAQNPRLTALFQQLCAER